MTAPALAKADHLVELARYAEARAVLTGFLALEPDSEDGWCLLALCELKLDRPTEARNAAERALALEPESDQALRLQAVALSKRYRQAEAWASALAAVEVDPNDWRNHYTLAQVYLLPSDADRQAGSLQRARRAAERAVSLAPHEPDVHVMWGLAESAAGRGDEARDAYERALELDPQHAIALNNLAAMDLRGSNLASGAKLVVAGLKLAPGLRALHQNLDAVGLHILARVFNVNLIAAVALILLSGVTHGTWLARAAVGVAIVVADAVVVWLTLRHLPGGARRHLRGLPRRMTTHQRVVGVALVLGTLGLLTLAFFPGDMSGLRASRSLVAVLVLRAIVFVLTAARRQRD